MSKIKISALGAVYHRDRVEYLDKALVSLFSQRVPLDEIVLVCDGPLPQDLDDLINKYSLEYTALKVIKLEKNKGLGNALNVGLMHCSNEYIMRYDSDDINRIERSKFLTDFILSNNSADVISSTILEFGFPDNKRRARICPAGPLSLKDFIWKNPVNHAAVIFKKSKIIKYGGYSTDLKSLEDYELWIRSVLNGAVIVNIDVDLVDVRVDGDFSKRRGGLEYVKIEYNMMKMKYKYKINGLMTGIFVFTLRALPRVLPSWILYKFYTLTRYSKN